MPDYTTRKRLKKKLLDRWENEGGMILEKQAEMPDRGMPEERGSGEEAGNAPTSQTVAAGRSAKPGSDQKRNPAGK